MPRNVAIVKTSVWETGNAFRLLHWRAQWAYLMLISQRQINTCGVLPYTPDRWQNLGFGATKAGLSRALAELAEGLFIILDKPTGELLVRTYIRHDGVWKKPNLIKAAQSQYQEILSLPIRAYLAEAHPWVADVSLPVTEGVSEPVSDGVANPRAQGRPPSSFLLPPTSLAKRDDMWDLLVELFGPVQTQSERGRRNKTLLELRQINATTGEVREKAAEYRRRWPTWEFTARALVSNWSQLDRPPAEVSSGVTAAELMAAARRAV